MSPKKLFITTPIYYANGPLHIGHMYTACIADVIARMKRVAGYDVIFSTGSDENGQKMVQSAEKVGKEYKEFVDDIAKQQQESLDALSISYTDFIRTSSDDHREVVQALIQKSYDAGYIEKGEYEGLYCVGCESFKKEGDLIEKDGKLVCPDHLVAPNAIKEENWFFKLGAFTEQLQALYAGESPFVYPDSKFQEVKSFVEQGIESFSVSRPHAEVGIPVPFDEESVVYIWFDALINYYTVACRYGKDTWADSDVVHCVGKDISRFHCIYRPAMLQSLSMKLPDQVIVNGFFTIDGMKISKSLGNGIDPKTIVEASSRDAVVYTFFSDIKIGNDGDFSIERCVDTHEAILKKGRGNLVSRVHRMIAKYESYDVNVDLDEFDKALQFLPDCPLTQALLGDAPLANVIDQYATSRSLQEYCRDWYTLVQAGNKIMDEFKPRITVKNDVKLGVKQLHVLSWLCKGIRLLGAPLCIESTKNFTTIIQTNIQGRNSVSTDTCEGVEYMQSVLDSTSRTITDLSSQHLYT